MGKNNKSGSLKTPQKALVILEKYRKSRNLSHDLIFDDLKVLHDLKSEYEVKRRIAYAVNRYNKMFSQFIIPAAGIEGKITIHISRHTFATLAADKIPVQMFQQLYLHSDLKTTIGYQANFIYKDADEALNAVIGG